MVITKTIYYIYDMLMAQKIKDIDIMRRQKLMDIKQDFTSIVVLRLIDIYTFIYRVFQYLRPPFHSQTGHRYIPKLHILTTLYQFPITNSAIYLLPVL